MSPNRSILVLLAVLLAKQAVAQAAPGCSWVVPTMPSISNATSLNDNSNTALPTSDAFTTTVIAEISMTAFQVCNGTAVNTDSATVSASGIVSSIAATNQSTTTDSQYSNITAHIASSLPTPASSLTSFGTSYSWRPTISNITRSASVTVVTNSSANTVPNLPSSLQSESIQTSARSHDTQSFSMTVPAHHGSTLEMPPHTSMSWKNNSASSVPSQTTSESKWFWTKTYMVSATHNSTTTVSVSTAQTTKPLLDTPTTRITFTTSAPCSTHKVPITTLPATQPANIVSQLPDGQIQAGNSHINSLPPGTVTSVPCTHVAENPPSWTPESNAFWTDD